MTDARAPPTALTLAGIDPSGGAGVTADLRAFGSAGVWGRAAVSCLTVQTSARVDAVEPVAAQTFLGQAGAAIEEGVDAVKTGVLPTPAHVEAVLQALPHGCPIVVDPVLVATSGAGLTRADVRDAYLRLAARATLVTPNRPEACALTDRDDPEEAAWALRKTGAGNVLVTGGDGDGPRVEDLLLTGDGELHRFEAPRTPGRFHGTGCTLSALAAAHLAQGYDPRDAVEAAIGETHQRIRTAFRQAGASVLPAGASLLGDVRAHPPEARRRAAAVARAWRALLPELERHHVPEVGSNLSYLPPDGNPEGAAALAVRCTRAGRGLALRGPVEVGGRHHTARVARAAHRHDPDLRVALNLRPRPDLVAGARAAGLVLGTFRRGDEPADAASSMEWGTGHAFERSGHRPDVVLDEGGPGKEAMMRVLGRDPQDVVGKVRRILGAARSA